MLKKEKKERVVLAKEHPLPKDRMVSTIFDPRKLCIINAQRQPGKERGGGDIMENNGDVKTALSHQLASPPPTLYYWWVGVVQSASRRNFVIQRYTGKNYPLQWGSKKIQILKSLRAFCLIALPRCLNETFPSPANLIFTPANSPGAHNGVTSKSDCFCRSSHGWRFCRSVQEEWRRGSSYKVGLTAAGGSRVNAHSLTPSSLPYTGPTLVLRWRRKTAQTKFCWNVVQCNLRDPFYIGFTLNTFALCTLSTAARQSATGKIDEKSEL